RTATPSKRADRHHHVPPAHTKNQAWTKINVKRAYFTHPSANYQLYGTVEPKSRIKTRGASSKSSF
ncbi:MAG: hypothetical protein PHF20_08485, partial [Halothiobacillaceae bacterium]|nr:hypothetical protein [Halothiobacillaceae bacterium]